jgi:Holliday junction resolvasome RuvABC DNA-binding subunit
VSGSFDPLLENRRIASRLAEVGEMLAEEGAGPFRVDAWRRAARTLENLDQPVSKLLREKGWPGLDALPGIGPVIGRAILSLATTGRLPMLDRLRAEADPSRVLMTVPGIGPRLARRLQADLQVHGLYDLEAAARDGRLAAMPGIGKKRLAGVRESLAARLDRIRVGPSAAGAEPPVDELLAVDREYREGAARDALPRIAPRRFNPGRRAWLPILHTARGSRLYTALFSNTARAHELGKTRDWVVIYLDSPARRSWTVVTENAGPLAGLRVVRGREAECADRLSGAAAASPPVRRVS